MRRNRRDRFNMFGWSQMVFALVLGAFAFWLIAGFGILNTANIHWLAIDGGDATTHYLGWFFFRNDYWHWPIGLNPNYGLEYSSSIIFSDSVPFMAFVFKSISWMLPPVFQYSGWWILICFILQAYFSILLLGRVSDDRWVVYSAAVLFVFSPPMICRLLWGHFALAAQWLVLWALFMYLNSGERRFEQTCKWAVLLAISAMVHTYLLAMILPIWAASIYKRVHFSRIPINKLCPEVSVVFGSVIGALWLAGFFPLRSSYLSGGYGVHRVNLLALFNSHGVASLPSDQWSYIFPQIGQEAGDYEGFNYLGLGGLVVFWLAIVPAIRFRHLVFAGTFKPLAVVCLLLTIFGVTNHIGLGSLSFDVGLPQFLIKFASVLRASGRFFWPVFYVILLSSVALMVRFYPRIVVLPVLILCAVAQVTDTHAGWRQFRERYSVNSSEWPRTIYTNEDVVSVVSKYSKLRALPASNSTKDWDHLVNLAISAKIPTDVAYLARANDAVYEARAIEVDGLLRSGKRLPEDSVYILNKQFAAQVLPTMELEDRMFVLSGEVFMYAPAFGSKGLNVSLPVVQSIQELSLID